MAFRHIAIDFYKRTLSATKHYSLYVVFIHLYNHVYIKKGEIDKKNVIINKNLKPPNTGLLEKKHMLVNEKLEIHK